MSDSDLPKTVLAAIRRHRLVTTGDHIIVGFSGGPDSVALLAVLDELRTELGLRLQAVHVHHGLRKAADTDAEFARNFCRRRGIPCSVRKVRVAGRANLEERAREQRFAVLTREARKHNGVIALGHHRDDQAETVLMRILRGSGLMGLGAMPPRHVMEGIPVVRPLLDCRREDILAYLKSRRLKFREDTTNHSDKFLRNRVRSRLLPLLEREYNPAAREVLSNLAQTAAADYAFLKAAADRYFERHARIRGRCVTLPRASLAREHLALRRMVIRCAYTQCKGDLRQLTLSHLAETEHLFTRPAGSSVHLPAGITAKISPTDLTLRQRKA